MLERPIINITHNAGFFSCCTIRLMDIVSFHNEHNILPLVNSSSQWYYYKDFNINIDITDRFFLNKEISDFNPEPLIFCKTENQFSNYSLLNYQYINKIIDTYFSPSNEVLKIKNFLLKKYDIDLENTISVCYRGNDKSNETNVPTYEEISFKLDKVIELNPNKKILIQSDEIQFYEYIKKLYPKSILIEENKMISKSRTAIQFTLQKGEKIKNAQTFLATMLIMSECSNLIINSGNVGMWICLYRGNIVNVYQYLNPINNINNNKIGWQ